MLLRPVVQTEFPCMTRCFTHYFFIGSAKRSLRLGQRGRYPFKSGEALYAALGLVHGLHLIRVVINELNLFRMCLWFLWCRFHILHCKR
jgi:hypothetical protein